MLCLKKALPQMLLRMLLRMLLLLLLLLLILLLLLLLILLLLPFLKHRLHDLHLHALPCVPEESVLHFKEFVEFQERGELRVPLPLAL